MAIKTIKPGPGKGAKKPAPKMMKPTVSKAYASDTTSKPKVKMAKKPTTKPVVKPAPKKSYTTQDSAKFEAVGKRFDKDMGIVKRLSTSKDVSKQDSASVARSNAIRRADTMSKNAYYPEFVKKATTKKK
jgi:hypothetical protein